MIGENIFLSDLVSALPELHLAAAELALLAPPAVPALAAPSLVHLLCLGLASTEVPHTISIITTFITVLREFRPFTQGQT